MIAPQRNAICPLCQHKGSGFVLITERQNVPVEQNFLMSSAQEALNVDRGTLTILMCPACTFVFNRDFDPAKVNYNKSYENKQYLSHVFLDYLTELWDLLRNKYGIKQGQTVVEVGCGQGFFLEAIVENLGLKGVGFDPAYRPGSHEHPDITYYADYFSKNYAHINADLVLSRHVIEHIQNPLDFLSSLNSTSQNLFKLFLETPDITWILKHKVLWDFFYEHCSYFSPDTLRFALSKSRFEPLDVDIVFEEQYLWAYAQPRSSAPGSTPPSDIRQYALDYAEHEVRVSQSAGQKLGHMKGDIAIWGAGAKGVSFANYFDPQGSRFTHVIDINPDKQGAYIPGTAHEIVLPQTLGSQLPQHIIVMNPNYFIECQKILGKQAQNIEWHSADELIAL